jgi:8-oxo-dGTP pyrophosphatase MutT (NUDIX family)
MLERKLLSLKGRKPNILGHKQFPKYAVLIPVVKYQNELCVIFEKRAQHLIIQPGEICFPGGAVEENDSSQEAAAKRETCEELNLELDDLEIIAALDLFVSPFSIIVYPYLGIINDYKKISINRDEVEYIFYVPLNCLLESKPLKTQIKLKMILPEDFPYELIPDGRNYTYRDGQLPQNFYFLNNEVVWGLTAGILNHFIDLLKNHL